MCRLSWTVNGIIQYAAPLSGVPRLRAATLRVASVAAMGHAHGEGVEGAAELDPAAHPDSGRTHAAIARLTAEPSLYTRALDRKRVPSEWPNCLSSAEARFSARRALRVEAWGGARPVTRP
jgi:hypothetical protein